MKYLIQLDPDTGEHANKFLYVFQEPEDPPMWAAVEKKLATRFESRGEAQENAEAWIKARENAGGFRIKQKTVHQLDPL